MSLTAYIANLKEKPEYIRKRYAFWSSFSVTAVVAIFWASSMGFGIPASGQGAIAIENAVERAGSPAESLVAGVGDFAEDIWSMIVGPKKVQYSVVEVLPGPATK